MYKVEPVPENGMHKILCDFEMPTDYCTSAWRPHLVLINKKILPFQLPLSKNKRKQNDR